MTISKAARIKDWTREGVFYLTVRYQHVLWAAELPFVAAAIEEDAEARDSLELVRAPPEPPEPGQLCCDAADPL
jgi:hypothetical protein